MLRAVLLASLLTAAVALGACGDGSAGAEGAITVVATTTQAADLTRAVAGGRADVVGLLPANADPHDYEIRPDDVKALADAQLVVRSGGDLDALARRRDRELGHRCAGRSSLIDHVATREGDGEVDPHWWQDPRNAVRAVAAIEAALAGPTRRAPRPTSAPHAPTPAASSGSTPRSRTAWAGSRPRSASSSPRTTRSATTRTRYGLEVIGAVIPSLSTQAQASAGEVTDLVATIRREGVRAIFAESSVNPELERVVADESGARIGDALYADTLGPEDSDGATYLGSIAANTRAIAGGLSGGTLSCDASGLSRFHAAPVPGRSVRMAPERVVLFRPRTVLQVAGVLLGRRRRAVGRLRLDPRPHLGVRGAVPRARARTRRCAS